jgi:galactokinase
VTAVNLAGQLGLAAELRMALHGYQAGFGCLPDSVWRVPGTITLLASGTMRLTVATPWEAIVATGPGEDGVFELIRLERPGERDRVLVADAQAGRGPAWTGSGLTRAGSELAARRAGARLFVRSELPDGTGAGIPAAIETAIRLGLGDLAALAPGTGHTVGCAMLGPRQVPCDLATAGLRLVVIDTRVRGTVRSAPAEDSPVATAATAAAAGDFTLLAALLTAAHEKQPCDGVQRAAVSAALRAGALGARAIADGPGRPVCVLAPVDRVTDVRATVGGEFARSGYRAPRFLTCTPVAGPSQAPPR